MRSPLATGLLSAVALSAISCGSRHEAAVVAPPEHSPAVAAFEQASPDALVLLAADYFEASLCKRLAGRFVALPKTLDELGPEEMDPDEMDPDEMGPDARWPADQVPADGRLWIRDCTAQREGSALNLRLEGVGWFWVDKAKSGRRLRQYVSFESKLELTGVLTPHYDAATRIATFWFLPGAVDATGEPLGDLSTNSDGIFASAADVLSLGSAGKYADRRAREEVRREVTRRFSEKLQGGFTVTYNLRTQQVDFRLGHLAPGREPVRPIQDGRPWLANERQELRPEAGGFHVLGPFDPASGVDVDVRVEAGPGIRYWTECAEVTRARLAGVLIGELPHPENGVASAWLPTSKLITVRLAAPNCRWYLLTSGTDEGAIASIRVRATPTTLLEPQSP